VSTSHPSARAPPSPADFFGFFGAQKREFFGVHPKKGGMDRRLGARTKLESLCVSAFAKSPASRPWYGVWKNKFKSSFPDFQAETGDF
jgi:hypothetical protein